MWLRDFIKPLLIAICNISNDCAGHIDGDDASPLQFRVDLISHAILMAVRLPHQGEGALARECIKGLLIQ